MVRAIVFDLVGTLAHPVSETAPSTYDEARLASGVVIDDATFGRWRHRYLGAEHGEASLSEADYTAWVDGQYDKLAERAELSEAERSRIEPLLRAVDTTALQPDPAASDVLTELRSNGFRTALCADGHWDLPDRLATLGVASLLDVVVDSAHVGARTPNPLPYRAVLQRLEVAAAETLFVGSDWGRAILGPTAAGAKAAFLFDERHRGGASPPPGRPGVARLTRLDQVPGLARAM